MLLIFLIGFRKIDHFNGFFFFFFLKASVIADHHITTDIKVYQNFIFIDQYAKAYLLAQLWYQILLFNANDLYTIIWSKETIPI